MKDTVVFYHGQCPDGFGAAFSAWLKLGDSADYIACAYGQEPEDVSGKTVYILDFSFEWETMRRLDSQARELILLDHHKTAQKKLHGFQCSCGKLHFDLGRSGACLAWEHFHGGELPALIAHIQDRDLWKWDIPGSADYLASLDAVGFDFLAWKQVLDMTPQEHARFIGRGRAMNDKFKSLCESIAKTALPITLRGHQGLMVNAPSEFSSDVGNMLATQCGTFAVIWKLDDAETVKVSLRSNAPFEVDQMATHYGGGGHPQASAFRIPLSALPQLIAGQL